MASSTLVLFSCARFSIIASVIGVAMKAGLTAFTSTPCFAHVLDKPIARFRIAPFAAQ